jgi:3-oxoacyl-[acyl-carrier-protein] synthase-3
MLGRDHGLNAESLSAGFFFKCRIAHDRILLQLRGKFWAQVWSQNRWPVYFGRPNRRIRSVQRLGTVCNNHSPPDVIWLRAYGPMRTSTLPVGTGPFVDDIATANPTSATQPPLEEVVSPVDFEVAATKLETARKAVLPTVSPPQPPVPEPATRQRTTTPVTRQAIPRRTCSLMGVQIISSGAYVPETIVTNADLRARHGFDPDWIEQRTGIFARRHAAPDQATSDLCVAAAEQAIARANVNPADIDLLIVGTFTPDHTCPSTACLVQEKLNLDVPAFDLSAACSGFVYSLVTASQYVATGNSQLALVIGADCCSRIVNPKDQKIAPLFGDGAGAVLISRGSTEQGLLCYQLGADGGGAPLLECPASGTRNPVTSEELAAGRQFLDMDGRSVFMWAVRIVEDTVHLVLEKSGLRLEDVSLFLFHQANARILDHAVQKLGIPREKVLMQLDRYGNTSAGSIPLVLEEAHRANRIQPGDTILMCGFGAGLTWGTALFRW